MTCQGVSYRLVRPPNFVLSIDYSVTIDLAKVTRGRGYIDCAANSRWFM